MAKKDQLGRVGANDSHDVLAPKGEQWQTKIVKAKQARTEAQAIRQGKAATFPTHHYAR